ncbi:MAG: MBL fold metallo-hydrolase [Bacteroidota bacterium]|jgi:metallo-beta-lactamase family protein|nr:MBL fold metallo-hydrolase [Ignavibacteria bacterium]MCU7498147.1 MBL fold metallo-hydrolase [Ignavibacteria bacterium]MCU7511377.1 MBL fold metallo-hydrolase [Ignavibacteria bacterium]MCU7519350.1 MBL fold metallo-hydrolase [Ignavibacteria bacterium]MCU7523408.1 MBL fold metallo-hydrolase [Ignavibacteria bacterium]
MQISFIGAARTVTGSMHLVKANGTSFLLDCGMYQGKRKLAYEINKNFDMFDPAEIDFVILSHAHIDHAGNLPNLVKNGFKGNIYSTFATRDLASVMLRDSAFIQQKDVEYVNKKRRKKGQNPFTPLYTMEDVEETIKRFVGLNYHREFFLTPEIKLTFFEAGHILGSAISFLVFNENGRIVNLGYTGDLGRANMPILRDPEKMPDADFIISESTYGGRFHDNAGQTEQKLAEVINKAVKRKAKIIVPSFSVGRTQEMVYWLNNIFEKGMAERIPIYVDSPLSVNATDIFRLHSECFDFEISQYLIQNKDPFGFNKLTYIKDVEDSKKLNSIEGPCMIMASSGMAEAGRILHHLANNIENENNIILIVGYSAENTLGRKIVEHEPVVKIFGEEYQLKAEVVVMNSLSAHADSNELLSYFNQFDKDRVQNLFLVHGDFDQQEKFCSRLRSIGYNKITIPEKGDVFEV